MQSLDPRHPNLSDVISKLSAYHAGTPEYSRLRSEAEIARLYFDKAHVMWHLRLPRRKGRQHALQATWLLTDRF